MSAGGPFNIPVWHVDHIKPRATHPELTWDSTNWRAAHASCNTGQGQNVVIAKAKAEAVAATGSTADVFSGSRGYDRAETGPMYRVVFIDGTVLHAFADELHGTGAERLR